MAVVEPIPTARARIANRATALEFFHDRQAWETVANIAEC
jgi:hypothetical protein